MAVPSKPDTGKPSDVDAALTGGNYEVLRARLVAAGKDLATRAEGLNQRRKTIFGATEPQLVATERVRSEHNCAPVDIVEINGHLLLGLNVFLGLKSETKISDVLALHRFAPTAEGGFDTSALPLDALGGFLTGPELERDFANLYRYYRDARLIQLVKRDTQLLAVFQAGASWKDIKVLRWRIEPDGRIVYVDDRGDRDHAALAPPAYDFEWREVNRDHQVSGKHPHYNLLDTLFVECVHGDLTIKVENNTETGKGVYSEPVDDLNQSLDDARISFVQLGKPGGLVLLKMLPFREETWRYLVFDTRSSKVVRADGIGQGCRSLPEDHGVIFPGGYMLVGGVYKKFDGDHTDYVLERVLPSPNGEDVLYVYQRGRDGSYLLYPYNLINKDVAAPITCAGYSLFADGRMVVMRAASAEPTRVHPMQVWQTPFTSAEHAASVPTDNSYLAKVGNADLVRGLSDALSIARLSGVDKPGRVTFEDIMALGTRAVDAYYWLGHADTGDLKSAVTSVRETAKLILDEYEKVVALEAAAAQALVDAEAQVAETIKATRSEGWDRVDPFLEGLTKLRTLRGQLISKTEIRFIDVARITALEAEVGVAFDRVTSDCVTLLAKGQAFGDLVAAADQAAEGIASLTSAIAVKPAREKIDQVASGLDLLGNVIGSLKIDDTTQRTSILENITDAFGHVNRARAVIEGRYRELATKEGRAEFGAQVKLLSQSVASALAQCDTPDRCDQELTRLLVQVEELEGRFADVEELTSELATKREELVDAVGARKQQLAAERQRRSANLQKAAHRILEGVARRGAALATSDEVNAYFASDAMVAKLREIAKELGSIGDTVKADELDAKLKTARQDALRGQRDRADLFEGGGELIKFGEHRFTVNTQPLELMIVPHEDGLAIHLAGTDFYEPIVDDQLIASKDLWNQDLPSETEHVYRGEYLAASVLADAEANVGTLTLDALHDAVRTETLPKVLGQVAQERYDEGYERGVHDVDASKILERLLAMREGAGLLAYASPARALAVMFWGSDATDADARVRWHRAAQSLAKLADVLGDRGGRIQLATEIADALRTFVAQNPVLVACGLSAGDAGLAATYLVRELAATTPRFVASGAATTLVEALITELDARGARIAFEDDIRHLRSVPGAAFALAKAWIDGVVTRKGANPVDAASPGLRSDAAASRSAIEAAAIVATPGLTRERSSAVIAASVTGLLGRHPRIKDGVLDVQLDELTARLERFRSEVVPRFRAYRTLRREIADRERARLRIDELKPRVISSFVRNQLIDQAYLPLVGANLAKQLGAAGANKRTDQMGMLLLVSPPGYGKTTLMEYVAARLGLAFVKVNGPALGHDVTSLDPTEAPNATSRQEIEKVSLALEMGTNVMLYLDDIQHTSPELLQKFISLCDAQRKIEGVWRGKTRTYDLRGKKFCVVMAGNPYTESGETFRIPDMLANRADVYNLGDVLSGKSDAFGLSFLENALTSNPTLAPLATRDLGDVYKIIRMAKGEQIPTTELSHGYAGVELEEILTVLRHLFVAQGTLLKVNAEYIRSAAQSDSYRTEPPFKLQGSYRNMNKIAEKAVAAMTAAELESLVDDHYRGESQTLTTAAEQNLLKLAELRGRATPEQQARWNDIKGELQRKRRLGGSETDPVVRLMGTLDGLGTELGAIRAALADPKGSLEVTNELRQLREVMIQAARKTMTDMAGRDPQAWLAPRLDALAEGLHRQSVTMAAAAQSAVAAQSNGDAKLDDHTNANAEWLLAQVRRIESTLVPVVSAAVDQRASDTVLANKMVQIIELLEQLDARLSLR